MGPGHDSPLRSNLVLAFILAAVVTGMVVSTTGPSRRYGRDGGDHAGTASLTQADFDLVDAAAVAYPAYPAYPASSAAASVDPAVLPRAGAARTTSATIFVPEGADPDEPVVEAPVEPRTPPETK